MADYLPLAERKSDKRDISRAKALRKEAPLAERLLWNALQTAAKNEGLRFRRQHPFPPYTIDFICLKARLIIEIDGPSHDVRLVRDKQRDDHMKNLGYKTMRFTNEDVRKNLENVTFLIINRALELTTPIYTPLP